MQNYILIESRDPYESAEVADFLELAEGLVKQGGAVTLFLVQNAVLAARHGARPGHAAAAPVRLLAALATNGAEVLADSFSLRERGISPNRLLPGIAAAPISTVIDRVVDGRKALWH